MNIYICYGNSQTILVAANTLDDCKTIFHLQEGDVSAEFDIILLSDNLIDPKLGDIPYIIMSDEND